MRAKAPAKINLGLRILGRRADGFHDLDTIFVRIALCDFLEFKIREDGKIILKVAGAKILKKENLVWRAAALLQKLAPMRPGVEIVLRKQIPLGAGLGGGSSDAATTLKVLNKLWNLNLGNKRLMSLAAELGSDVPFFLTSGVQRGRGRGELLSPVRLPKSFPREVVLVAPNVRINTAWAYEQVLGFRGQGSGNDQLPITNDQLKILATRNSQLATFQNDFEKVVFAKYPQLAKIKSVLRKAGAQVASMSGSGSAVYGLFHEREDAERVAERMRKYGKVFMTKLLA